MLLLICGWICICKTCNKQYESFVKIVDFFKEIFCIKSYIHNSIINKTFRKHRYTLSWKISICSAI